MADVRVYSDEDSDSKSSSHFGNSTEQGDGKDKKSRAFVACACCRKAKAKCDLGDVNSPKEPPCARCRRRGITCEFLPSRRSGRMSYEARLALKGERGASQKPASEVSALAGPSTSAAMANPSTDQPYYHNQPMKRPSITSAISKSLPDGSSAPISFQLQQPSITQPTASTSTYIPPQNQVNSWPEEWQRFAEARGLFESQQSDPSPGETSQASLEINSTPSSNPGNFSKPTLPKSKKIGTTSDKAPKADGSRAHTHKRKTREKEEDRAEELAAANLRNPVDAMSLLVMAAGERKGHGAQQGKAHKTGPGSRARTHSLMKSGDRDGDETGSSGSRADEDGNDVPSSPPYQLSDFPLVKRGVLNTIEVFYYVNLFFTKLHPIFPLVPHHRIPRTEAQLTAFAKAELHLTTVFILIASRLDQGTGNQARIHEQTWQYMQELITRLVFGEEVSVGALEALLLLSENPPRALAGAGNHREDFAEENRMSWNIVGLAVRLGYMLSLDQISFYPIKNKGKESTEPLEKTERERIAWTYCYLFDRQIAIRTGKAFWSRGPGLMFSGSSADYFPSLRPVPGVQDDFASLLQAYAEITQILQNSHDVLYPSKDRSIALVSMGEYHKYLDEFTRALNNYRAVWETKQWSTFPLTECVWVTFHYVRLYVYAFAFQASVQRGVQQNNGSSAEAVRTGIFKKGTMSSPDARFLMESVEAACDMLRICTERLHPSNVLQYLPWRFFLYFSYAGVFLLKAIFLNAVASSERRSTVRLLRRLIICLASTSSDPHHHAVRYARLLDSLLRTFSRGQDGVDTSSPQDHINLPSTKPEPTSASVHLGGAESPWPVSRPVSPSFGSTTPVAAIGGGTRIGAENLAPNPGLPMSFWGGGPIQNHPAPAQPGAFSGLGNDYSQYGDINMTGFSGQSFDPSDVQHQQSGQQGNNHSGFTGGQSSSSYIQVANQNLGGQPTSGFSPYSDSMALPLEAYTNLLDDTTLDFWTALTNSQDWPGGNPAETQMGGTIFPGM